MHSCSLVAVAGSSMYCRGGVGGEREGWGKRGGVGWGEREGMGVPSWVPRWPGCASCSMQCTPQEAPLTCTQTDSQSVPSPPPSLQWVPHLSDTPHQCYQTAHHTQCLRTAMQGKVHWLGQLNRIMRVNRSYKHNKLRTMCKSVQCTVYLIKKVNILRA